MSTEIRRTLTEYYRDEGIHPNHFTCKNQTICRRHAHQEFMTETKMSMVGSQYAGAYPRIVVVSLDPPGGGREVPASKRVIAHLARTHEQHDYNRERPNVHWAMTQIIVSDILTLFGYRAQVGAAVVEESYAGRPIENVSAHFAHVNLAKCSMNNPRKKKAHEEVHRTCGESYVIGELAILQPEILITQGKSVNEILGKLLIDRPVELSEIPRKFEVKIAEMSALWCPMHHPARQLPLIRDSWPHYREKIGRQLRR